MRKIRSTCVLVALSCCWSALPLRAQVATVLPTVETPPVPSSGDAADDSVAWVHPTNHSLSTVIGTDKDSGLLVYDLAGNQLQYLPDGELNNVDLRYGFSLSGAPVALATSGERGANVLAIYAVDPATRLLHDVAARVIPFGITIYGCCMYRSSVTGDIYFFGNSQAGEVEQWRLFDAGGGRVDAVRVRQFDVGTIVEGCVADDETGAFFISEENVGIWRYGAEPGAGTARVQVDHTGTGGHLTADVEGLTIYYAAGGAGYLLASSQGNSTYVVYEREAPYAHRLTFQIGSNAALGIDGTSDTDGIDVTNRALGSAFPGGLFSAQDGTNTGGNQNFKYVPWTAIANAAVPPLIVDTSYDAYGTDCPPATATVRNGSGTNPLTLVNRQLPRLGSQWQGDLDCSGHAPGLAYLAGYASPASGTVVAFGELLINTASARLFAVAVAHSGNSTRFNAPVPATLSLCGFQASLQGVCFGAPAPLLSNALDLRLGL